MAAGSNTAIRPPHLASGGALRAVLLGVIVLLCAAALYTSDLILQKQSTLRQVERYNVTWVASQAAVELARAQAAFERWRVLGTDEAFEQVELWADIVYNRSGVMGTSLAAIGRQDPAIREAVERFQRDTTEVAAQIARLPRDEAAAQRVGTMLQDLVPKASRLAASLYNHTNLTTSEDMEGLRQLYWLFSIVLVATLVCTALLIIILFQNNRALEQRDDELLQQNARFDAALNNMSMALCMFGPDQRLIVCNSRFLDLFGLTAEQARPGAPHEEILAAAAAAGRIDPSVLRALRSAQDELIGAGRAGAFFREGPEHRSIAVTHQPMADRGWVATYEDITERRRAEAQIAFMAQHDALTGLPNRTLFRARMEAALGAEGADRQGLYLQFMDLDHFKDVNDTLGHAVGDALLSQVAERLRAAVPKEDLIARLGGDEFAVLQSSARRPEEAEALARALVEVISQPYDVRGYRAQVSASIGVVRAEGIRDAEQLLKSADLALYAAKGSGRRTWRFFEAEMEAQLQRRLSLEADLRSAAAEGAFRVVYQPTFTLADGALCGFEALLRWRHPTRGEVSPGEFIPLLEETGLVHSVGRWVLDQAFAEAARWPRPVKVAVNLSPVQFRSADIAETVLAALRRAALDPTRVELEITESVLLSNNQGVADAMRRFGAAGIGTALDDFGTRYSSLSYLRSFPFSRIKIDRSFVSDMGHRPDCLAIVHSVARLAGQLGMATTAEGIETLEQLAQVQDAGCTEGQGFFLGRPTEARDMQRWFDYDRAPEVLRRQASLALLR